MTTELGLQISGHCSEDSKLGNEGPLVSYEEIVHGDGLAIHGVSLPPHRREKGGLGRHLPGINAHPLLWEVGIRGGAMGRGGDLSWGPVLPWSSLLSGLEVDPTSSVMLELKSLEIYTVGFVNVLMFCKYMKSHTPNVTAERASVEVSNVHRRLLNLAAQKCRTESDRSRRPLHR
jgi:hypothetical protein